MLFCPLRTEYMLASVSMSSRFKAASWAGSSSRSQFSPVKAGHAARKVGGLRVYRVRDIYPNIIDHNVCFMLSLRNVINNKFIFWAVSVCQ